MEFDIQLTDKKGEQPRFQQNKACPASIQQGKVIETNLQEMLDLGVLETVEETPFGSVPCDNSMTG